MHLARQFLVHSRRLLLVRGNEGFADRILDMFLDNGSDGG